VEDAVQNLDKKNAPFTTVHAENKEVKMAIQRLC